jgi:hypothetical protein
MGWDSVKVGKNITTKKFVEWDIIRSYDGIYELAKIEEGKDGSVFACVYLTVRKNGWIQTKVIGESEGPSYYEASEKFIRTLSPTHNEFALNWRNLILERRWVA